MKILAFGAHPDDIEIFMFGLLCAYKINDVNDIILAIATDGSKGGINPGNELAMTRRKETFNALQDLGKPTMLNVVDGDLSISPVAEKKITKFIDDANPDLIITHDKNDYHSDHSALS